MATFAQKRELKAVEAFQNAAATIGPVVRGMALFALTRGQFSMIDAVLHCLDQVGPAKLSIWTWTVADYEVQCLTRLRMDERLTAATLIIDAGARNKNAGIIADWKRATGRPRCATSSTTRRSRRWKRPTSGCYCAAR